MAMNRRCWKPNHCSSSRFASRSLSSSPQAVADHGTGMLFAPPRRRRVGASLTADVHRPITRSSGAPGALEVSNSQATVFTSKLVQSDGCCGWVGEQAPVLRHGAANS